MAPIDTQGLADLSRLFIDRLVTTKAPADELARAADLITQATAILATHVPVEARNLYDEFGEGDDFLDLFRLNPVIGRLNPVAPAFDLEIVPTAAGSTSMNGREVVARMTLGILYEGPLGMVHGGIIASLFDQLLAIANIDNGLGAFTGTLTVVYRNPCPLDVPLRFVCRTESAERRKVSATGELFADDVVVAEAHGVFILPSGTRLAEIVERSQKT